MEESITAPPKPAPQTTTGFVVLNPVAGNGQPEQIKEILQSTLGGDKYHLYETTGDESLPTVVQTAVNEHEYAWVAAIGGDGTVSQVVNGLIGSDTPLLILPGGTANVLAQDLDISQDIEEACQLLEEGIIKSIDAMRIDDYHFIHQIGIGLESLTMDNTSSEQKNRWGVAAYLWTAIKEAFGWQPHLFTLTIDGKKQQHHASELAIANVGKIGVFGLHWDGKIMPDDGRLDIIILRARSLIDYAQTIWALATGKQHQSHHFDILPAHEEIQVETRQKLPVHGDGEVLEDTLPFTVVLIPNALKVFVPQAAHQQ